MVMAPGSSSRASKVAVSSDCISFLDRRFLPDLPGKMSSGTARATGIEEEEEDEEEDEDDEDEDEDEDEEVISPSRCP